MTLIDSELLNRINKPLEDLSYRASVITKAYQATKIKELKKKNKEVKSFVKEIKYIINQIKKLKNNESNDETKNLLKYNLIKLIKIQAFNILSQTSTAELMLKQVDKQYFKGLINNVKLIDYSLDKVLRLKTKTLDLTRVQKMMKKAATIPGKDLVNTPDSYSIKELSDSIMGNARIIRHNCEVLLYYFTSNGRKLHSSNKEQYQRIRVANKRINQCLEKLKKIS